MDVVGISSLAVFLSTSANLEIHAAAVPPYELIHHWCLPQIPAHLIQTQQYHMHMPILCDLKTVSLCDTMSSPQLTIAFHTNTDWDPSAFHDPDITDSDTDNPDANSLYPADDNDSDIADTDNPDANHYGPADATDVDASNADAFQMSNSGKIAVNEL